MNISLKVLIVIFLTFCVSIISATIINVPGDQPTIQDGINVAVDSDTVLVQPGTYIENINYNGKNITVASLFLTTQDTIYISPTIIDGNQDGSVVVFNGGEDSTAVLCGFTITNGLASGNWPACCGGGIYCFDNSSPKLERLTISGNSATYGGGISCSFSSPSLINLTISNNSANYSGGGIHCRNNSSPSLINITITGNNDSLDLNLPVYGGGGIYCRSNSNPCLSNVTISGNTTDCLGGGIYCLNSSPSLMNVTSSNNTAYGYYGCGSGIYCNDNSSPSLVNVTISENNSKGLSCDYSNPILQNVTISENGGHGLSCNNSSPILQNVTISDNGSRGIDCNYNSIPILQNVIISGNSNSGIYCNYSNPILQNVTVSGNSRGLSCYYSNPSLQNVIISSNSAYYGGGILCSSSSPSLVNVTISDNTATHGGGIACYAEFNSEESSPSLINCIMFNDSPEEIFFDYIYFSDPNSITISYSDIQGGEAGIVTNNNGTVNWLEGNIDEDPLFTGTEEDPYSFFEDSPCIDTGIPDTTGLNLPPWDIIGNLRIWDGDSNGSSIIDMGAYEYGAPSYVGIINDQLPMTSYQLSNYPNPFNPKTTISFNLSENGKVNLSIYNIKGQKIKTIVNDKLEQGLHQIVWDGKNDKNQYVASGVYFYKLEVNNKNIAIKRCLLLK